MHIWDGLPEAKVESATYFDPLWFEMYANRDRRANVLSWIKEKGILSKKCVFVPIVKWSHWSLLIMYNLGQSLDSETNAPCLLLLDSLQCRDPKRLEPSIRRLLIDIYESEERTESKKELQKIPLWIPEVPQQKEGNECRFYVLFYIRRFIESPPSKFQCI
ncbi:ubiquitin-like-specific protease 1D [Salvia splendens]|uniref:ubiquitin-like-specific protease 1D n=1 Tax=Salvia splendens TaxID=180675 RepID=UPI001C26CEDE|nr:ubiquitin-like-specific protease 1D [Salvia splendens]XP_041998129.1 ubiquitin-like-specific protease 1D [Salvia splendens]